MFLLFLILGFSTLGIGLRRQYHFVNESKTWAEAQSYCREHYKDLASVDNREQTLELVKLVDIQDRSLAWIGLYDDLSSWRWSLDDDSFYKENERNFRNWYIEKPRNWGGNNLCAALAHYSAAWTDVDCVNTNPFICYDGRVNSSASYVFITQLLNWNEAQRYCREHYTDLASARDDNENDMLRSIMQQQNNKNIDYLYVHAWIGLYRTRSWSDNSNSSFSFWKSGQPDNAGQSEYCTAVSFTDSGQWTDENCNQALPFLCYIASEFPHQYHFVNESKSWAEAQRYCRENHTDLATIDNMEEMNSLINTVNGSYTGLAWIGLYDDLDSWRWSYDNDSFYKEGERDFRGWTRQPDNYNGNQMCVYMNSAGTWFDDDCNNCHSFVCHDRRDGTDKFVLPGFGCLPWSYAQSYCRAVYTDLASVRNWTDNQRILNVTGGSDSWIGLYRTRLWSDQHKLTHENWRPAFGFSPHEPDNGLYVFGEFGNQHCTAVSFSFSGQWTDENCLAELPFVCYTSDCTESSCFSRQYRFVIESKSWAEAQRYCRQNYTDLATIDNMEEMNRLINTVNGGYTGLAWIGLYDDLDSWRWSLNDERMNKTTFSRWYIQKPTKLGGQSLCVLFSNYLRSWWEFSCSQEFRFICYDGRQNVSQRYVLPDKYLNWTEAQRYCREHYTDLISVRNEAENDIINFVIKDVYGHAWIGLYRTRTWSDNSNSSFSFWKSGQPDNARISEYCTAVSLSDAGQWTDENCALILPFLCYSGMTPHQYHFVNESKSWAEAQRYCRENYTDLATIDNMEEMNSLINTVNGSYTGLAWIGLYDDLDSWRWSYANDSFYKEGERDFRGWFHEPDNFYGKELCVSLSPMGEWYDRPCTDGVGFVCFNDKNNTSRYVWISDEKTWTEAQRYCRERYTDLASVRNETELQEILRVTNGVTVWIGLYRNRLWSDQSKSTFTFWKREVLPRSAEPNNQHQIFSYVNEHCTAVDLYYSGYWTDEHCFSSLPFFCYSDVVPPPTPGPVVGLRVKVKDGKNRSESEIKRLVLMQLQEEFIRMGLPSNFTLKVKNLQKISP